MKGILFSVLLLLSFVFSCKEEDQQLPSATMSFTLSQNENNWIILSDESGNVLASDNFGGGEKLSFDYQTRSNDGHCTVTIIFVMNSVPRLISYTNVLPGDYDLRYSGVLDETGKTNLGKHILQVDPTGLSKIEYIPLGYCGYTSTNEGSKSRIELDVCLESESSLYAFIQPPTKEPKYLFKQLKAGEETNVNLASYDQFTEMEVKQITIPKNVTGGLDIKGYRSSDLDSWMMVYFDDFDNQSDEIDAYYPVLPNYFKSLSTNLYYTYSNDPNVLHFFSKRSSNVETAFSAVEATLEKVVSKSTNKLLFELGGKADYVQSYFYNSRGGAAVTWEVYSPFSNNVEIYLPEFTAELKEKINLSTLTTSDFSQIHLINNDDPNQDDYSLFVKSQLKATTVSRESNNRSEKRYNLK